MSESGTIKWQSPSNIALVKYWGKHGNQLPRNPSLSMTLSNSSTTTEIHYEQKSKTDGLSLEFQFEGKPAKDFETRIHNFLDGQLNQYAFLKQLHLKISSFNTFPHSSGIASSASAFSALALGILTIEEKITGQSVAEEEFCRRASSLARLGSGSASRSVYGGYVVWGAHKDFPEYSDQYATPLALSIHPDFYDYHDAILIVSGEKKKTGSSAGHKLMEKNPYAKVRYQQANQNLLRLHQTLETGDLERFAEIVENEALTLHGLMLSSSPGYLLMNGRTISIIERIRAFRQAEKVPVCFTLDAGPNVHLLYPERYREAAQQLIDSELLELCDNNRWIDDRMGNGPVKLI